MASSQRIFLSSTYTDLVPYRSAVENLIRKFGELFVGMEHFGARSQPTIETCLEEVDNSDVLIVLVGGRYGTPADGGTSFTQREVERAEVSNLAIFVFIQQNPAPVSKTEAARRRSFVRWLQGRYTWASFEDEVSLVTEVAAVLRRVERRFPLTDDSDAWRELIERAGAAADWDCITLSAHNVDHVYSVDRVAADYETRLYEPKVTPGGSGANTIAGLGRMGLRVGAAGAVGNDDDGAMLRSALEDDNVTPMLVPLRGKRHPTGRTIAFTDDEGRRSIYVEPGANEQFATKAKTGSYLPDLRSAMSSTRLIHYSSFTLAPERNLQEQLIKRLSKQSILSLTPGALYCKLGLDRLSPLLKRANVLFLYEQQLDALLQQEPGNGGNPPLKDKISQLYKWKRRRGYHEPLAVVIKNASYAHSTSPRQLQGVVGRTRIEVSEPTQATVSSPSRIRDSTGAGDASATGMLWAILQMQPFDYALDLAYVFARSACSQYGGRAGLPTESQLRRRWRTWIGTPYRPPY